MVARDRERYHQLHPAKLLVDWGTAIAAGALLWWRQPLAAVAVGFGPSIIVTLVFLSGRLDHALETIRSRPVAQAIGPKLSSDVNALRFVGLALSWAGCWLHQAWWLPAGLFVIAGGWWLAWRRGVSERSEAGDPASRKGQTRSSFRPRTWLQRHRARQGIACSTSRVTIATECLGKRSANASLALIESRSGRM